MSAPTAVSHIPFYAWDRERSFEFFVDTLGFYPFVRGNQMYCGLGDVLIELFRDIPEPEEAPTGATYSFGIEVADVEATLRELEGKGIKVLRPLFEPISFYGHQAVIDVPGGPPIAIRDYRRGDGPHFMGWQPPPAQ